MGANNIKKKEERKKKGKRKEKFTQGRL